MGLLENSTRTSVCSKSFVVEIDTKFQTLPRGTVNVTTFTSPTTHEEGVFLIQLVARGAVIFVHISSAKYTIEAVLTAKTVAYKHCSEGSDQEVTKVDPFLSSCLTCQKAREGMRCNYV